MFQSGAVGGVNDAAVAVVRLALASARGQIALIVLASHIYSLHAHEIADGFTWLSHAQYQKSWLRKHTHLYTQKDKYKTNSSEPTFSRIA